MVHVKSTPHFVPSLHCTSEQNPDRFWIFMFFFGWHVWQAIPNSLSNLREQWINLKDRGWAWTPANLAEASQLLMVKTRASGQLCLVNRERICAGAPTKQCLANRPPAWLWLWGETFHFSALSNQALFTALSPGARQAGSIWFTFLLGRKAFAWQFKGRTGTVQAESCERKSLIYKVLLRHRKPPSSTFVPHAAPFYLLHSLLLPTARKAARIGGGSRCGATSKCYRSKWGRLGLPLRPRAGRM